MIKSTLTAQFATWPASFPVFASGLIVIVSEQRPPAPSRQRVIRPLRQGR